MSPAAVIAVLAAGLAAGAINAVVGSGSLITFPTLLAAGYSPLVANVSNTVGLVFGSVSAAVGYRRELRGQRVRVARLGVFSLAGGLTGALLLLALPQRVFESVVPALVLLAVALVVLQPWLGRVLAQRRSRPGAAAALRAGVFAIGVYGGYFGAAQGVILLALLALLVEDSLQRLNGLKNALAAVVNGVAAVVFAIHSPVAWEPALLIAGSSIAGGQLGAGLGRRLSPLLLRAVIVVGGLAVVVKLLA